jgi:predicted peptidase
MKAYWFLLVTLFFSCKSGRIPTVDLEILRGDGYLSFVRLPSGYDPERSWPLIMFLHGSGEATDNLIHAQSYAVMRFVNQHDKDFEFIVLSPQAYNNRWGSTSLVRTLESAIAEYSVDESRIYVTGLSLGGGGTWSFAAAYPERVAAIAPVAGGFALANICNLKDVPVWAFHNRDDPVASFSDHQKLVSSVEACGGDVEFTIYNSNSHDAWSRTYSDPDLYEWFLTHAIPGAH